MTIEPTEQPQDQPENKARSEEQTSLNADDLDVQELDEKLLESVAGGSGDTCFMDDGCSGYSVTNVAC